MDVFGNSIFNNQELMFTTKLLYTSAHIVLSVVTAMVNNSKPTQFLIGYQILFIADKQLDFYLTTSLKW